MSKKLELDTNIKPKPNFFKKHSKHLIRILIGCVCCCLLAVSLWIILLIYLTNWAIGRLPDINSQPQQNIEQQTPTEAQKPSNI